MSAFLFYLATLIVYGAVDSMACLALNVQFGFAGLSNFGFIIFQAGGAYVAAILSMGNWHKSNGGFQQYVLGWHLPWPLPWIGAALFGGLLALPFVFLVGKRLLGALLVPLGFEEATRFIPPRANPGLVPALEWVAI